MDLTDSQRAQVDACVDILMSGGTPQELRDLGYAEAAIRLALAAVQDGRGDD